MCSATALQLDNVPVALHAAHHHRSYHREGVPELRFCYDDKLPELPVVCDGQFQIVEWGNKRGTTPLPADGWCSVDELESGRWRSLQPESVKIMANFGQQCGRWFLIESGINGVLVRDKNNRPHVYMLTETATHYYEIMTHSQREPLLIDQRI